MIEISADKARKKTEKQLTKLEKKLTELYSRAQIDLTAKANKYFSAFEKADTQKQKLLQRDKITEKEYRRWRKNKILYSRHFENFSKKYASELANVNSTALRYINGEVPGVYMINYNELGLKIKDKLGRDIRTGYNFDIIDADTVRILAADNPNLLPALPTIKRLNIPKDKLWNRKKMNAEILQGIIEGESIPKIAARFAKIVEMNKVSAYRNARTMITSAENGGRIDSMARAMENGVVLKKQWISSDQPGRTRDWHFPGSFESIIVDIDKPFENAVGKIMYPGDPSAHGANVYNCRCALGTVIVGFKNDITGEITYI